MMSLAEFPKEYPVCHISIWVQTKYFWRVYFWECTYILPENIYFHPIRNRVSEVAWNITYCINWIEIEVGG